MLGTDAGTGGTQLTGGPLEFGAGAPAASTFALAAAVTDLPVLGEAGGGVQRAVAGAAGVVCITDAFPAFTAAVTWQHPAGRIRMDEHVRLTDDLLSENSPPHSLLLERSQLKLSHSQYLPL